jgi:hypothetical protein
LEPATEGGNDEGEEGRSRARQGGARAGEDGAAPKAGAANLGRHAVESGGAGPEKGEERKKEREWVTVSTVKWTHGAFLQKPHCRNWSTRRRIFFIKVLLYKKKITQFGPVNTRHVSENRDVPYPSDINKYYAVFRYRMLRIRKVGDHIDFRCQVWVPWMHFITLTESRNLNLALMGAERTQTLYSGGE